LNDILADRQILFRDALWHAQDSVINLILKYGLESYLIREDDVFVKYMFRTDVPMPWGCMDGRFDEFRIATAGPGVFWTPEQKQKVVAEVHRSNITVNAVYRHRDCGAEAAVKRMLQGQGATAQEAEKEIERKTLNFANQLNAPVLWYNTIKYSQFHYERSMVLIGPHIFDIKAMAGIYPFQLNLRFCPDLDAVLQRTSLAIDGIAFADHGWGKQRFEETPFLICIIGDPTHADYNFASLKDHLEPLLKGYGNLVTVRGFDVPEKFLPKAA